MVQGNNVYPAAGYISMTIEGMRVQSSHDAIQVGKGVIGYEPKDIEIINALLIPETSEGVELQLSLRPCNERLLGSNGWVEFRVQSVNKENKWTDHCTGDISIQDCYTNDDAKQWFSGAKRRRDDILSRKGLGYRTHIDPYDLYAGMRSGGKCHICHGPIFRNITTI